MFLNSSRVGSYVYRRMTHTHTHTHTHTLIARFSGEKEARMKDGPY